jgi:alpha-D-ribose 1-methylphosphonate 5-triphosphate synthase subunit PhnG
MWPLVLWQNRLLVAALALGAAWGHGWVTGRAGERAHWQARTAVLVAQRNLATARAAGQAEILRQIAAGRAEEAERIATDAAIAPDAQRQCLDPEWVLRLNRQ